MSRILTNNGSHNQLPSPENRLVINCAHPVLSRQTIDLSHRLLRLKLDWNVVLHLAHQHSVLPLLNQNLKHLVACLETNLIPDDIMQILESHQHQTTIDNLYRAGELSLILDDFDRANIETLVFKGPAVALSCYGSIGLRNFSDLDLLIPECKVLIAREILIKRGFEAAGNLTPHQQQRFLSSGYHWSFARSTDDLILEVHWRITPRYFSFPLEIASLWQRRVVLNLPRKKAFQPSPEDCLLALCAHGAKHAWERLVWISDVAHLIQTNEHIDWNTVMERAQTLRSVRLLLLGLWVAHEVLGAPLPSMLRERITRDAGILKSTRTIQARLLRREHRPPNSLELLTMHLRARESWQDALRYGYRVALMPSIADYRMMSLPSELSFLYYAVRPFRLAANYVKRLRDN